MIVLYFQAGISKIERDLGYAAQRVMTSDLKSCLQPIIVYVPLLLYFRLFEPSQAPISYGAYLFESGSENLLTKTYFTVDQSIYGFF